MAGTGKAGCCPFDFHSLLDSRDPKCQLPLPSRGAPEPRSSLPKDPGLAGGPPFSETVGLFFIFQKWSGGAGWEPLGLRGSDLEVDTPQGCCVLVGSSRGDGLGPGCAHFWPLPPSFLDRSCPEVL